MRNNVKRALTALPARFRQGPRAFIAKEDGTITIFGLMMFVLMLGIGGIAIDVMRYETQRVQLQNTLDRAVLAAASLTQTIDPRQVVENYFQTSGLENYRLNVELDEGLNYRQVSAQAEMEINSVFMQMFGIRTLTSPAFGAAEERVRNIEISMVLDISGSMGSNNRITNMRSAAREFVTTVLDTNTTADGDELVSISIVPYNGRVNAGDTIESVFTLTNEHTESSCTRFATADFAVAAMDPSVPIQRVSHFDLDNRNQTWGMFSSPHCQTNNYAAILPWEHDETALHNHINSLNAEGWTAIDLGMKWAVGLLDPAAQPAVTALIGDPNVMGDEVVHEDFAGRPALYTDNETLKIIVMMTDGENTRQYDVRPQYRSGPSNVYYHAGNDRYSVWYPGVNSWFVFYQNTWENGYWASGPYGGNDSVALTWQYLWATYTENSIAERFFDEPSDRSGNSTYYNQIRSAIEQYGDQNSADTNLRASCDAARAQGIIVFAIGFEAPQGGQEVMRYCATTAAHYYDVQGVEISEAFASIARTINQLRLVQ